MLYIATSAFLCEVDCDACCPHFQLKKTLVPRTTMALPYCCEGSRWQGACVRTTIENIEPDLSNTVNWGPEEDMRRLCVGSPCALEMAFRRINTCLSRKQLTPSEVNTVVIAARTQETAIPAVGTVWRVVTVITKPPRKPRSWRAVCHVW